MYADTGTGLGSTGTGSIIGDGCLVLRLLCSGSRGNGITTAVNDMN